MNNSITWKEVSREYVISLNDKFKPVLIYNPIVDIYRIEYTSIKCIANYKYAEPRLKYYMLEEVLENGDMD